MTTALGIMRRRESENPCVERLTDAYLREGLCAITARQYARRVCRLMNTLGAAERRHNQRQASICSLMAEHLGTGDG